MTMVEELEATLRLARVLLEAKGFLPNHLTTEGAVVATILAGRELGLPPMISLRGIRMINGKPELDASLKLGVMAKHGIKTTWLRDGEGGVAELEVSKDGHPSRSFTFTWDDAKRAGLTNQSTWRKYPQAMLRARCVSITARAYGPAASVLAGCYVEGELSPEVTSASSVAAIVGEDDEQMTLLLEKGKDHHAASMEVYEQWKRDLTALVKDGEADNDARRELLESWCHHHGPTWAELDRKVRNRVETLVKRACKALGADLDAMRAIAEASDAEPMILSPDLRTDPVVEATIEEPEVLAGAPLG